MEKSRLERFIIGFVVTVLITFVLSLGFAIYAVNSNGGIKETLIIIGKDMKEIGQEISKG